MNPDDLKAKIEEEEKARRARCPFYFVKLYVRFVLPGEKITPLTPEEKEAKLEGLLSVHDITGIDERDDEERAFDEEADAVFAEMIEEPDAIQSWRALTPLENLPFGPYICAIHAQDWDWASKCEGEDIENGSPAWWELIQNYVRGIYDWAALGNIHTPYVNLDLPEELIHEKLLFHEISLRDEKTQHALYVNRRDVLVVERSTIRIGYDFYIST